MEIDFLEKTKKKIDIDTISAIKEFVLSNLQNGEIYTVSEKKDIFNLINPVLFIVKPHAIKSRGVHQALFNTISKFQLEYGFLREFIFNTNHYLSLYKELCIILKKFGYQESIKKMGESFFDDIEPESSRGLIGIAYGEDSYIKMKAVKKVVRDKMSDSYYKNVLHTSDNFYDTCHEFFSLNL